MSKIDFIKTEDFSTGLYCNDVKDIFHSKTGALTEAYEKFYLPIENFINNFDKISVLDICYGIGYNSKVLLHNSYLPKIKIDALEYDENLIFISPFIKDGIEDINLVLFLINSVINSLYFSEEKLNSIFNEYIEGNFEFFDNFIPFLKKFITKEHYKNILMSQNNLNLHNIYYKYISTRTTDWKFNNKFNDFSLNFHLGDARKTLNNLNKFYDIVFLDAFSSQKDPTLWTIDFLSLVKSKMKDNALLVSYSKATPFRSALKELGFCVGKTFINDIDMGTVASFNQDNIINPLSDYDINLIKTRSGITYKDPYFSLSPDEIKLKRELEQKNSNLISHTQFLKLYQR